MKRPLTGAITIALLLSISVAHADDYREQILIADGLGLSLVGVAGVLHNDTLGTSGAVAWLLTSPVVHLAHGENGDALKSTALRLGATTIAAISIFALTATTTKANEDDKKTFRWLSVAMAAIAVVGASAIDAAFLASNDSTTRMQAGLSLAF